MEGAGAAAVKLAIVKPSAKRDDNDDSARHRREEILDGPTDHWPCRSSRHRRSTSLPAPSLP
ncbi:hypothetical protein E2562_030907 [Oryza meyeriana var. granulata]|uniref:Uncharacterized protein n=1 Tax=Oryza meyeriana var. granulata TaxID=110450 RepID=A0A6G1E5F4_9ORYZ|nr:hypothetical protein E2562_030907 [Oryza meyeriana var. granulata]